MPPPMLPPPPMPLRPPPLPPPRTAHAASARVRVHEACASRPLSLPCKLPELAQAGRPCVWRHGELPLHGIVMVSSWLHRHNCRHHRSCARVPMRRCACVRAYVCASRACNVLVTRACVPCAHACVLWCARVCTVRARVCAEDHGMRVRAVHTQDTICARTGYAHRACAPWAGCKSKSKTSLDPKAEKKGRTQRMRCSTHARKRHARPSCARAGYVHAQDMRIARGAM